MFPIRLFIIFCSTIINSSVLCSSCESSQKCITFLTQKDCGKNEFLEMGPPEMGCCPRCKKGLGFEITGCNDFTSHKKCAPGLKCKNSKCVLDKAKCSFTYHLPRSQYTSLPICKGNGAFAAKQCKGDKLFGRCFCYSDDGKRIFGWDWWRNEAENNMTCACSHKRYSLEKNGRLDVTLHCSANGNYEKLQCDSGICWCAEPKTGEVVLGTRAVPENMWTLLPCHNEDEMGAKYLRQCESAAYAQNIIRKKLYVRGMLDVSFNNVKCDYDGSYGAYFVENRIAACIWRDGRRINPFQANSNQASIMDCNCARDAEIFAKHDLNFPLACSGNGNYDPNQDINGQHFCVDRDGFAVTGYFALATVVGFDCKQYLYYEAKPDQ